MYPNQIMTLIPSPTLNARALNAFMNIFLQFYKNIRWIGQRYSRSEFLSIIGALCLLALTGTVIYSLIEGWSLLDALYATVITITTVGYGDFTPKSPQGRIFAIFFTLIAITIGGYSISTLAAYTIESRSRNIAARFRKQRMNRIKTLQHHFILCGADLLGTRIAEEFYMEKVDYVVIDDNETFIKSALLYSHPEYFQQKLQTILDFHEADLSRFENLTLPELSEKLNVSYILGDPTDDTNLIQAGIDRAAGLIAARADDRDNLSIVIGARSLANRANNTTLRIMTRANDPSNVRKMYLAGADFVRIPTIMSGMEMASHMLHPEIGNWWYSRVGQGNQRRGMFQQVNVNDRPQWVGKTVAKIHELDQLLILTIKRKGEFISPPEFSLVLQPDDIAIILGRD